MGRRMIDPQTIIKSQIVDDRDEVDLNEILEEYGTQNEWGDKSVTLQFYSKESETDNDLLIYSDEDNEGYIIPNTAITITKNNNGIVFINGLIVDSPSTMNLLRYININSGDYENGIILSSPYEFDVHVIKV